MPSTIVRLYQRFTDRLGRVGWLSPLLLRGAVGVTFVVAGWGKLHHLAQVTAFFESLGIPAAGIQAPMVATIEFFGGGLVLVGLGTRIASALLGGVMIVATATAIWPNTDGVVALLGTIEIVYLVVFLHLVIHGAGAASLDHLLARRLGVACPEPAPASTQLRGAS